MPRPGWKNCAVLVIALVNAASAFLTPQHAGTSLRTRMAVILSAESATATTPAFSSGFDSGQMDALVQRGVLEASLMQATHQGELEEPGKKSGTNKKKKQKESKKVKPPSAAVATRALKQEGVIRLNGALSATTAAALREQVLESRAAAYAAIEGGDNWRNYFADVLLKSNRCDMLLPLKGSPVVQAALRELLIHGTLANVLLSTVGDDASLYELSVLISEPGSPRQPVHPDNPHQEHPPLVTCFVALQDIDATMGPTTFLPKTHTAAAHAEFDNVSQRDAMLETRPNVHALLNTGDVSVFDSRTMHCGGCNKGSTRALFYVSFRNPRAKMPIGNVGSIRSDVKPITLRELRARLGSMATSDGKDAFDDSMEEPDEVKQYRLAAEEGNADAQFNLGLCYRRGEGVEQNDIEAFRLFQLAAEEGGALAQCNLGSSYYLGQGVEKNEDEAVRWFELAAEQGLAHAQHNLGFCYSTGVGVRRDLEKAANLFQLAAKQGHPGADVAYEEAANSLQS
jgi:hypothetical protein